MAVEPIAFLVGPVSRASVAMLAGMTGAYAALTGLYAWRGLRARLEDRWSAVVATLVMGALAVTLWQDGARMLPAPFCVFVLAVALFGVVFTLTYTLGQYQRRIARFKEQFGDRLNHLLEEIVPEERLAEWKRLREHFQPTPEGRRKTPHLLMGVFLVFYAALGFLAVRATWDLLYGGGHLLADVDAEGIRNLYLASHSGWLAAGHLFSVTLLLGLLYILTPTELLRLKYPELSYPFKSIILSRLRPREQGLFGAHYYLAAATPLAVLWLTRDPTQWDVSVPAVGAIIVVTVFADAASALVGIRWGKAKWFHNAKKSYLGSMGGTTVAFLATLPLLGVPGAVVAAVVFLFIDIIAPVPVSVSDNLLYPVTLSLVLLYAIDLLAPLLPYY